MDSVKNEVVTTSLTKTENGALGYKTTGKALLDINYNISSMRDMNESDVIDKFINVYYEDKVLAIKWLFFARDVRGGLGERRLFRLCFNYLANLHRDMAIDLIPIVPEYGRWDDLWVLIGTPLEKNVIDLVKKQLKKDTKNANAGRPISLLAKWLPRANTSSKETRRLARKMISLLGMTERNYRKKLSKLNSYLKVIEVDISANRWGDIDYSSVPSNANVLYNAAFLRHDLGRRNQYLRKVNNREEKINTSVLFPHDIVTKYNGCHYYKDTCALISYYEPDTGIETMWKSLPDYVKNNNDTLCVVDGSGSMCSPVSGRSKTRAIDVARALGIYFSERCSGDFKDRFITFSNTPKIVDLSNCNSLYEKLELMHAYNDCTDTNIESVFELILETAIDNHMNQDDLPKNILVLSDMEFNYCVNDNNGERINKTVFDTLINRYEEHGYKMPKLIFWNVCSRTSAIPLIQNDLGVLLVSGFNPVVVNMVLSGELDAYKCLLNQLNSDRYQPIEDIARERI